MYRSVSNRIFVIRFQVEIQLNTFDDKQRYNIDWHLMIFGFRKSNEKNTGHFSLRYIFAE